MKFNKLKSILFMGFYDENYIRNDIFIKGLRRNNVRIYEFNLKSHNVIKNIRACVKNYKRLKPLNFDLILMYGPSFIQLIFAKILSKVKEIPLINDIHVSKLQTFYYDRRLYNKNKMPKIFYPSFLYLLDFVECIFSNYIILDTYSHIKFFREKFNIPIKKFRRVLVGAQDYIFHPLEEVFESKTEFVIGFWGSYIPLQGVEYIIRAAKLLENDSQIKFTLIGNGQTYQENRKLARELELKNIEFVNKIPLKKLPESISKFNISLGIFGNTPKTLQVIPNKIYEGIAMKCPMISCDSPAIRELFTKDINIVLCERANPESLAKAILKLKNNTELREKIKQNAYVLFQELCTIDAISKILIKTLNEIRKKAR